MSESLPALSSASVQRMLMMKVHGQTCGLLWHHLQAGMPGCSAMLAALVLHVASMSVRAAVMIELLLVCGVKSHCNTECLDPRCEMSTAQTGMLSEAVLATLSRLKWPEGRQKWKQIWPCTIRGRMKILDHMQSDKDGKGLMMKTERTAGWALPGSCLQLSL